MGLTDDWQRLLELERLKGTLQYGQNLSVEPGAGNPDTVQASKDLIRFVGEKTDVNAWRVYLGPWQTKPNINVLDILKDVSYADPTPWAPPEPRSFDSFITIPCYARVQFGSGGIQHTAYVDWPKRGLLFQVSGSYVQVNAFVNVFSANSRSENLPLLQATLAPEPGGGDAAEPATFTYPPEPGEIFVGPPLRFTRFFQIPPFARSFVPLVDWGLAAFTGSQWNIDVVEFPNSSFAQQGWQTPVAGVLDQNLMKEPFPIIGQQAGAIRIVRTGGGLLERFGMMFFLDL